MKSFKHRIVLGLGLFTLGGTSLVFATISNVNDIDAKTANGTVSHEEFNQLINTVKGLSNSDMGTLSDPLDNRIGIGTTNPTARLESYGNGLGLAFNQGAAADIYSRYHVPLVRWWTTGAKANGDFWFSTSSDLGSDAALVIKNGHSVGIGTTAPQQKLGVAGAIDSSNGYFVDNVNVIGGGGTNIYLNSRVIRSSSTLNDGMYIGYNSTGGSAADLRFYASGTSERMRIKANSGNVGIGTNNPIARLDVRGPVLFDTGGSTYDVWIQGGQTTAGGTARNLAILGKTSSDLLLVNYNSEYSAGTWIGGPVYIRNNTAYKPITALAFYYSSDESLKKNIKPLENSIEKIKQLRGVSFDWKTDNTSSLGLIAQEVEEVYPDLVGTDEDGLKSVKYGNLVAPLIEAVKELSEKIDTLFDKYLDQAERINNLEKRLEKLENN